MYGIGYTEDGSPSGKILAWKQAEGRDAAWGTLVEALEACELDGWAGYVFEYPSGRRPSVGWGLTRRT